MTRNQEWAWCAGITIGFIILVWLMDRSDIWSLKDYLRGQGFQI